ncbi:MFS general substrate transporter [Massarina eburnea CBS 473.64]|uniref:MFS general substrate transporter n=1 Tax=Massarina eburnea CBS 473.64 TaxID=1395130 RepID=A0A6A6S701_9PLEO|nr:MFS general substrate transporter [Massarina eburnea CBS 473.64]
MAAFFKRKSAAAGEKDSTTRGKSRLGILSADTDEVPGSVILLSRVHKRNEPLGLQHAHARTSASSLPSPFGPPGAGGSAERSASAGSGSGSRRSSRKRSKSADKKKRTPDGKYILDPQPDDSDNDPLNWKQLRRDVALVSLGFYCMVGGGMTPVLAAGFKNVAATYHVSEPQVALTTGLYMLGLGIGSVIASPTAILYGKRPVYLAAIILFCAASIWCAYSPNYSSLVVARIVQGLAVSPVECLPSATVAEIFFLHERAYRLGIYTLLLLGGKNLIPLVSAVIVQSLGWRWVFKIVAITVAFCFFLIFFFVPETFWDRTPHARGRSSKRTRSNSPGRQHSRFRFSSRSRQRQGATPEPLQNEPLHNEPLTPLSPASLDQQTPRTHRVGFALGPEHDASTAGEPSRPDYFSGANISHQHEGEKSDNVSEQLSVHYTDFYRTAPPKSYVQSLRPWNGRLTQEKWLKVMTRPLILMAYPAVLWSSLVYALAVGWLIVLSESVAHIYQNHDSYNFTSLQVGLVYISPFVGGVLGTAVAGKFSDIIVRFMARKNDGVYEPEFRLVMAIPISISTVIGLMGFGWSAEERDNWIVPTIFFGVISFGCSLASTTAVTFVVDSYRQYAGEALVTLNFCKNILHGFIFSLFFPHWLESSGPKNTFIAVGGIQLACMLASIPMYIYGKRGRMWTVRKNFMEKF